VHRAGKGGVLYEIRVDIAAEKAREPAKKNLKKKKARE